MEEEKSKGGGYEQFEQLMNQQKHKFEGYDTKYSKEIDVHYTKLHDIINVNY